MIPPEPLPGWTYSFREGKKVTDWHVLPTYLRSDGWSVVAYGRNDCQIGWTYWPKIMYNGAEFTKSGMGWGPSAILKCMKWVDANIPVVKNKPNMEQWLRRIRMYLYEDGSRDALFLLAECP